MTGHAIMAGVNSLADGLPARPTLRPGAEWVASWNNGTPLVAVQAGRVVGVNIFAFDGGDYTGDVARLFHNAAVHIARTGFALTNVPALPASVPPLGSMTFEVVFMPDTVGSYASVVEIESNDADEPGVEVQLTGQGILDYLSVTPAGSLVSQGHPGGPFNPVSASYTLSNGGPTILNWTVSHTQVWVSALPSSGALAVGQSVSVTVGFAAAANALAEGMHHDLITFSNITSSHFEQRSVRLTVFTSPIIAVTPASLSVTNAEGRSTNVTLVVSNALVADGNLTFGITAQETGNSLQAIAAAGVGLPPAGRDFTELAPTKEYSEGRLLVRFAAGVQAVQRAQMLNALGGAQVVREYKVVPGLYLVKLAAGQSVNQALRTFNRTPGILYAEPDYAVKAIAIPNDPRFGELWGMNNTGQTGGTPGADIDAPEAWDLHAGSRQVIVAVIDTGVDYTHPDLTNNIWTNPGEIPGNGLDDDHNGFVDDVHGYDFVNGDGDPMDDHSHGTHCAGTIGAEGNNGLGVAGVCWKVSIMALKFLDAAGNGTTADAISAIEYATLMGARVLNNSWGGGGYEQSLKDAIDAAGAANIVFAAAAGNDFGSNNDATPFYPAGYDSTNILAVMATDRDDLMSEFSNFGLTTVDLAGPGTAVLSCAPGGGYQLLSGTSMATPHVVGACALLLSANPLLNVASLKQALISSVDTNLPGLCVSGGRLNLARALASIGATWITVSPTGGTNVAPAAFVNVTVGFHAGDLAAGSYTGRLVIAGNDLVTPSVTIPVSMRILADALQVTPSSVFSSVGAEGGPFAPSSMAYTLTNVGASSLDWAVAHTQNWVSVSAANGTLTAGASLVVTGLLNSAASLLTTGMYADTLVFSNSISGALRPRPVTLSVVTPQLSIADASVVEGDVGTTNLLFTVSLVPPTVQTVTVAYATANGTAQAGTDYAATNEVLTFLPGQTNATVMVAVFGDTNAEPTETFFVNLSSPINARLTRAQAAGRILADDVGPFFDDFEPDLDLLQWSAFGGSVGSTVLATNHGGSISGPNSLWFGAATNRHAASRSLDATLGGVVDFWLRLASGAGFPWEQVDLPEEGIALEYSVNDGGTWVEFGRYDTFIYTVWTHVTVDIPVAAQTGNTQFRWRQLSHSGDCCDHWALDDVTVFVGPRPPTITTQPTGRTVTLGGVASLDVGASGSHPLSYQWRKDGTNLTDGGRISGALSNRLTIANVPTNDAGLYSVLVTNLYGSALSSNAVLTVQIPQPPPVPFGPIPTNHATVVSIHTLLSWNNGSGMGNFLNNDAAIQDASLLGNRSVPTAGNGALESGWLPLSAGSDDFDRPDGTDLGSDWVERSGDWRIAGLRARSQPVASPTVMTFSGTSTEPVLAVDVFRTGPLRTTFTALVSKYADANNFLTIKVQDNAASGTFGSAGFYYGNGGGWTGMTGGAAFFSITPFTSARITTRLAGNSIALEIDANFDGVPEQTHTRGGIPLGSLGNGIGLSGYDDAAFDNFSVDGGTSGAATASYDVYLGTNAGALSLIASHLIQPTCNPGTLAFDTTYFWQVVASNVVGSVTGAVWTFTTTLDEVHFAAATSSVPEHGGPALVTVVRENPSGGPLTVHYATTNGTAIAGLDYTAVSGTLTFAPGALSANFLIPILDDNLGEGNKTILLGLSQAPPGVLLSVPSNAVLTIVDNDVLTLGEALDAPHLTWTTGGNAPWLAQTTNTHDGVDAARSGLIDHGEESWVETTVTGPGTLSFWWKVSSESCCDPLTFSVNGAFQAEIRGDVNWTQRTFPIAAGPQLLRWIYSKDGSVVNGLDAGLVDQVSYVPTVGPLHHFSWSPIAPTQRVNSPFPATLSARDSVDNLLSNFTGTVALSATAGAMVAELLRVNFESGLQGFVIDNDFGSSNGLWHLSTGRALNPGHSSSNSLYYGRLETATGGGNYDNGVANGGAIISPPITLPAGPGSFSLSFNYLLDIGAGTNDDRAIVAVSTNDGASYTTVASKNDRGGLTNSTGGLWVANTVSLSAFAGSTLRLRLAFDSMDATANGTEGWYVDDVVIRGTNVTPVALSPASAGPFVNGSWSGLLAVQTEASDLILVADDGLGHLGGSNPFSVVPVPQPILRIARGVGGTVDLSFASDSGITYNLEGKNSFSDVDWTPLSTLVGDGGVLTYTETPTPAAAQRFYRLRVW